jgi:hypothetical protein
VPEKCGGGFIGKIVAMKDDIFGNFRAFLNGNFLLIFPIV